MHAGQVELQIITKHLYYFMDAYSVDYGVYSIHFVIILGQAAVSVITKKIYIHSDMGGVQRTIC